MSIVTTEPDSAASPGLRARLANVSWARQLRLVSGCILFTFLTFHLINHAAGIFGLTALDTVQTLRWSVQMKPVVIGLIYGAFAVHICLGLWRFAARRTLRMALDEALQLMSGVLIPILLIPHVVHTRIAGTWFGGNGFYETVLQGLWPDKAVWQITLVIVAWLHGVIGLHMSFRHRRWFQSFQLPALALALLIPALAIAGFIAGAREADRNPKSPAPEGMNEMLRLERIGSMGYVGIGFLLLGAASVLQFRYIRRRLGAKIVINYRGRGPVSVPTGSSVLDASRIHNIPHPSLCRGKGRCSTCRVQILSDLAELPEPNSAEQVTLARIGAPPNVRLACQLRPGKDISVRIVLPVLGSRPDSETRAEAERWAVERVATVMVLDIRAFERILESKLPYELVAMVNRFLQEMRQAVENHGGTVAAFYGDGLIAVFEEGDRPSAGARLAINAARDMTRVLKILNKEMGGALPIPIRAGIGIHTDRVTLALIGETEATSTLMAFGSAVSIADILQGATKSAIVDCLVSEAAARAARLDLSRFKRFEIDIERAGTAIPAYGVSDWRLTRAPRLGSLDLAAQDEKGDG